jgi:hypothetical protein
MSYVHRRRFLLALFLAGLLLIAIAADATTLARLQFRELVHNSSAIARLRFLNAQTTLENSEICTDSVFEVVQAAKGNLRSRLVVRTPGGTYRHLRSHVDGVPEFHPGEEVFLFLVARSGTPYRIVGWTQGTFRIRRSSGRNLETVTQDSAGMPVFDPQSRQFVNTGIRNLRVDLFLQEIQRELRGEAP